MVNRIDNNSPYEYPRIQNAGSGKRIEAEEKFSLDYGKGTNLSGEEQREKLDQTAPDADHDRKAERDGVRLELSGQGQKTLRNAGESAPDVRTEDAEKAQPSLWASLRDAARLAADRIKALFHRLWYDAPRETDVGAVTDTETAGAAEDAAESIRDADAAQETQAADVPAPTAEELTSRMRSEEARIDREVQPYLKSGNLSQVVSLLTDNGKKTVANNSTLLTYYDRRGNVVELSASDRDRILHGDRNVRRL